MNKNYVKIKIAILSIAVISSNILFAGSGKKNGTAGAQELSIPVGANSIALNGSNFSNIAGIEAMYWNPAGVSLMTTSAEFMAFNTKTIADIGVNYLAIGINFGDIGVFSFSLKSLDFGDIPVTTEKATEGTGETFSPTFITSTIGYSIY